MTRMDLELARAVAAANGMALLAVACQCLDDHQAAMEGLRHRLKYRILATETELDIVCRI